MDKKPYYRVIHLDLKECNQVDWSIFFSEPSYVVFWWGETPLGHFFSRESYHPQNQTEWLKQVGYSIFDALFYYAGKIENTLIPDIETWNEDNYTSLFGLFDQIFFINNSINQEELPKVSVVICTRNRTNHLKNCLEAFGKLSYPPQEIIVVDNAPSDNKTQLLVAQYAEVKYVLEPNIGLDYARNAGIKAATCQIIAYTDDDVQLHKDWIFQIAQSFQNQEVKAVTGPVFAYELQHYAQFLFEKYWSFNRGYVPKTFDKMWFWEKKKSGVPVWEIGAGASMAFRRDIFDAVGPFDLRLDMGAAGCNGDSEMWYRILAEGWQIEYNPRLIAFHTHRSDLKSYKKQVYQYLRGFACAVLIQYSKYKNRGDLQHLFKVVPLYYLLRIYNRFRYPNDAQKHHLFEEIKGYLSGILYYFKNRNKPAFEYDYSQKSLPPISETEPLVSIVITTYNHARYLPESIESALKQTYPKIELIVVDDGSSDNTYDVVAQYPQARYIHQHNQGLSAARNTGYLHSNGQFLIFLDADDWLYPDAVRTNLMYFTPDSPFAFVSGTHDKVDDYKKILSGNDADVKNDNFYTHLLLGNYIGMHATVMYRKEVFNYFRYKPALKACEDYDLYLRIARTFPVHCHRHKIAAYRFHDLNMSRHVPLMIGNVRKVLENQYNTFPIDSKFPKLKEGMKIWTEYYAYDLHYKMRYPKDNPNYKFSWTDFKFTLKIIPKHAIKFTLIMLFNKFKNLLDKLFYNLSKNTAPTEGKIDFGDLYQQKVKLTKSYTDTVEGKYIMQYYDSININEIENSLVIYTKISSNIKKIKHSKSKKHIEFNNVDIFRNVFHELLNNKQKFDAIYLENILSLVDKPKELLENCHKMLNDGGTLYLITQSISNPINSQNIPVFYTFSPHAFGLLLDKLFPASSILIKSYGNPVSQLANLYGIEANALNNEAIVHTEPEICALLSVQATKSEKSEENFQLPIEELAWEKQEG